MRVMETIMVGVVLVGMVGGVAWAGAPPVRDGWSGESVLLVEPTPTGCAVTPAARDINVRARPGEDQPVVVVLAYGSTLPVAGHNAGRDWYAVWLETPDGVTGDVPPGWVAAWVGEAVGACEELSVIDPPADPPEYDVLMAVPVLPDINPDRLREIFERGQALEIDARAVTWVGDCNTASELFLNPFDQENYDLGPYGELEDTVLYFAGWFTHESMAGQVGFNALTMLDPIWVDPALCEDDEGPLACEYRRVRPAVAVMMFGPNDM
ncbi:MAG: SH3 domain-containing protein, partial [Chloroflexi bacterium]|nr:SH3 domain-containing protein [Chloroflexota bacterium]